VTLLLLMMLDRKLGVYARYTLCQGAESCYLSRKHWFYGEGEAMEGHSTADQQGPGFQGLCAGKQGGNSSLAGSSKVGHHNTIYD
jgi:hypothetical protein